MNEYAPRYNPRPGSKTARAAEEIRRQGGMSCQPLAEILVCDPRNVRNFLEIPLQKGFLREEHRGGLLFFVVDDTGPEQPGWTAPRPPDGEDMNFICDEFGPAAPSGDSEKRRLDSGEHFPVTAKAPSEHSGPSFAIFSDGRLVVTSEEGDLEITFSPDEVARLRRDIRIVLGSEIETNR